jgi:hypothetical protein
MNAATIFVDSSLSEEEDSDLDEEEESLSSIAASFIAVVDNLARFLGSNPEESDRGMVVPAGLRPEFEVIVVRCSLLEGPFLALILIDEA